MATLCSRPVLYRLGVRLHFSGPDDVRDMIRCTRGHEPLHRATPRHEGRIRYILVRACRPLVRSVPSGRASSCVAGKETDPSPGLRPERAAPT